MTNGIAVIGAAFGDEGKGLMTDYFAAKLPTTVVIRYNGGAQAGHTVVTPLGQRHVFHHLGSGTFAGAPTYLSEHFILNPVLFAREWKEFKPFVETLPRNPMIMADPECHITLISDMMLNQWAEEKRGMQRHGSCGVGIGETIERFHSFGSLTYGLAYGQTPLQLRAFILMVNRDYVPIRAHQLGIDMTPARIAYLNDPDVIANWIADFRMMRENVTMLEAEDLGDYDFENFIFEGAQGLALDGRLDNPFFPHVTRSRTGRTNIVSLAEKMKLERLDFTYLTRSYLTRHGAGLLAHERAGLPYAKVHDETNKPHDFQGTLRFSYLDLDLLRATIDYDRAIPCSIPGMNTLAVTCMDQVNAVAHYFDNSVEQVCRSDSLPVIVADRLGLELSHMSYGPTRKDVSLALGHATEVAYRA